MRQKLKTFEKVACFFLVAFVLAVITLIATRMKYATFSKVFAKETVSLTFHPAELLYIFLYG